MSDNIQTNTTGRLTPCLQKKIDKTTYLVEVHFSDTSTQSVEDKLKRVILHDLEHGKQGKQEKMMNTSLTSSNRQWKCGTFYAQTRTATKVTHYFVSFLPILW